MKYFVNGTLRSGKTRQDLQARIGQEPVSDEAWALVRNGMITEHGFKTGDRPGFILVMESESEDAVQAAIAGIPLVREGWFDVEVDPMSPFVSDLR